MPTAYGGTQKGRTWAQPVLARDVVRHVGEPVAVVVADSAYRLADALDAVTVDVRAAAGPVDRRIRAGLGSARCTRAGPTTRRWWRAAPWATPSARWPARTSSCESDFAIPV